MKWIVRIVLSRRLGLDFEFSTGHSDNFIIEMSGKRLVIFNDFFLRVDRRRFLDLDDRDLPMLPLLSWDLRGEFLDSRFPEVPVIFGKPGVCSRTEHSIHLNLDIFGSAFLMLSRLEELIVPERDNHDRFQSRSSIAGRGGFLSRPIIDEYVEVLARFIQQLWPNFERKMPIFSTVLSHDVDSPSAYAFRGFPSLLKNLSGDCVKRRDATLAFKRMSIWWRSRHALQLDDPFNTFDWIMTQSEVRNLRSSFYFICGRTEPSFDALYEIEDPAIVNLLKDIKRRGHIVGLHPSYQSYLNAATIEREFSRLQEVLARNCLVQESFGGRMHYLRWHNPTTLKAWDKVGLSYDSTLGYADRPGFRCGTCFDYPAFDLDAGIELTVMIRPLVAMDVSVLGSSYLGVKDLVGAYEIFNDIKTKCRHVSGQFTLLWHNSELHSAELKELYQSLLT